LQLSVQFLKFLRYGNKKRIAIRHYFSAKFIYFVLGGLFVPQESFFAVKISSEKSIFLKTTIIS